MANFSGRLTVINGQSSLDNNLLLRAGFPDASQAIFAATQFLLKTKGLTSGQPIIVTGEQGSFGAVSVIVMTDAFAAAGPEALGAASPSTRKTTRTRRSKKSGGENSPSASPKGASRKSAAARKRGAAKSSAKK